MRLKRISLLLISTTLTIQMCACNFSDTKQKAKNVADITAEKAGEAKDQIVEWYHSIDMEKFNQGWDKAAEFISATYSAEFGENYIKKVGAGIDDFKQAMKNNTSSARNVAQEAGYVAEKWVAGTFNIDAIAGGSAYSAKVENSNKFGSVDVSTTYGENASLKYYKDADSGAKAQAINILEKHKEYTNNSNNPKDLEAYIDQYVKEGYPKDQLVASIYEGQTRIIPTDKLAEAKDYLDKKITKLNTDNMSEAEIRRYQETMDNLTDRLHAPDGTESKPLTYDDCQAITELMQNGDIDLLNEKYTKLGITPSQIITPKYVIKKSISSGLSAAALQTVMKIGPDMFSILVEAAKTKEFDEEQLQKLGIDGLLAGSDGFIEGSVSCMLLTLCQSGKLGKQFSNASPELIGTLTVIALDAMRYGYSLSKGEISTLDYSNLMAEEILVAVVSVGTGVAVQALLGNVAFAYMAGSMAGGMIATTGFQLTKDIIMEVKDGGGFEAIVPINTLDTMNVISDKVSDLHITDQLSSFKDTVVSTVNGGYIEIKKSVSK